MIDSWGKNGPKFLMIPFNSLSEMPVAHVKQVLGHWLQVLWSSATWIFRFFSSSTKKKKERDVELVNPPTHFVYLQSKLN